MTFTYCLLIFFLFYSELKTEAQRKLFRSVSEIPDSPYAWESREYLRKLTLAHTVKFSVSTETSTGRIYGVVYVKGMYIFLIESACSSLVIVL